MTTSDDDDYTELEAKRRTTRKSLALFGLVVVGGLLLYKCASQADRFGFNLSSSNAGRKASPDLDLTIERSGQIQIRGCRPDTLVTSSSRESWTFSVEDCAARAKVRVREGEGSSRVAIHVEPGAPAPLVRDVQALVQSFELTPAVE